MGCGSSRAQGRDNYGALLSDPEPLTPLVRFEPEEPPRLDSFLTELEASREWTPDKKKSTTGSRNNSNKKQRQQQQPDVTSSLAPFTLQSVDSSNRDIAPSTSNGRSALALPTTTTTQPASTQNNDSGIASSAFPELALDPSGFDKSNFSLASSTLVSLPPPPTKPTVTTAVRSSIKSKTKPITSIRTDEQLKETSSKHKSAKKSKKKKRKSTTSSKEMSASKSKLQLGMHMDTPEPSSGSGMRFDELYQLSGVLGTGAFSTVREGHHRSSATITYAVKCVNRRKLSEEDELALLDEVEILKEMKHIYIIRLYDFFVEPATYYLVMERMSGGELFDRIVAKAYYNEKEARDVCKIVLEAVGYLHNNNVAHRDLKPENLLLLSESDDSQVKIADFGFAKKVNAPQSLTTQCGTPGYVAPEILEGIPYDTRADMWSVGVILYILLGGYPPFIESNQRDLFRKIRRGEYEFHDEYWGSVSADAKDLIRSLLTVDPVKRLDADQALENQWICADDVALAKRDLGTNLIALSAYNAKRKFKAAVKSVMAVNKLKSLGEDFLKNLS